MAKKHGQRADGNSAAPPKATPRDPKRETSTPAAEVNSRYLPWVVFAFALAFRLLFWQATADRHWPHSVYYQGDALVWLDYALALQRDLPVDQGLPLRPPANGYWVAALWDGTPAGIPRLKAIWCLLGAAAVAWMAHTLGRTFGAAVGWIAGLLLAASTPLLILSTSLNNETPYLLVVAALMALFADLRERPAAWRLGAWGVANALACLFRAEHLLFFALASGALVFCWRQEGPRLLTRRLAWIALAWAVALAPWHASAWQACRAFNRVEPVLPHATEQTMAAIEAEIANLTWEPAALAEREALPAASRRTLANFVALTVKQRGDQVVRAADFDLLQEAFGAKPTPLAERPLLVLYGGLNFYLANNPLADGFFDRAPLEQKPPLRGGIERYPRFLVAGLPPPDLALTYPPHLEIVNHGYRMGMAWIADNPGRFVGLAWKRLGLFWRGAAGGLGGYGFPGGLSGTRQRVDMVTSENPIATGWRLLWVAIFALGLFQGWRRPEAWPWLALFATQCVANLGFFGYARLGALGAPAVLALGVMGSLNLVRRRWPTGWPTDRQWLRGALAVALVLLAVELGRTWVAPPEALLDGRSVRADDHWPVDHHEIRQVELR